MTTKIYPCPCGKTPERLVIIETDSYKWKYVSGNCCNEWNVEFRAYPGNEQENALQAWNNAPRGNTDD